MKKMISLIISASIFLQMVVPAASMVTYAQTGGNPSNFKWMDNGRLDDKLDLQSAREQSTEALVSWGIKDDIKKYELEYFIENQKDTEKVRFTFEKVEGKESDAKVTLQVLDTEEEEKSKEKDYYEYDFSGINPDGVIKHIGKESIEINITEGTRFSGGRVSVGNMEIKFRWKDGKIHFHTNYIKHGNITPFTLIYGGNTEDTEVIKVLTGIDGYNVSPVHIETQTTGSSIIINNKQTIKVPEGKEEPGSKPGVKVEFKRPKQWVGTGFTELQDGDEKNIHATLVLEDLTGVATAQLNFDLSEESDISGLGDTKQLLYDKDKGVYSLYLAKDDLVKDGQPHENIVKWEKLDKSMILKTIRLTLIQGKTEEEKAQALGSFTPNVESGGRHTYLGYTIHRSSMEEAFIRIKPYSGARNTEYKYFVQYADSMKDGETKWVNLVEHTYRATGDKAGENEFTIPAPFSSNFSTQYYRVIATYNEVEMSSQILHYEPDKDQTVPPPTPVIRSIDNIYAVPPEKLGDQPETIGFDLTWSAPKNTSQNKLLDQLLEKGSIYYELFFHEDLESTDGKGILTKIFKIGLVEDKEGNDVINVESYGGTAGKTSPQIRYNASKETFTMENVVIKNPGTKDWEQIKFINPEDEIDYEKRKKYPMVGEGEELEVTNSMPSKEVPGIYYFTMRALYEANEENTIMGLSNTSNSKSITISSLQEIVPVPTKMESRHTPDENDSNIIRETLSWENVNLDRYIKQMLDPLDIAIDGTGNGVYEIYLHQNKNIKEADLKAMTTGSAIIFDTASRYEVGKDDIETLRNGGAIRLDYPGPSSSGMNSILLDGLDANQVYYITIRVRLDLKNKDGKNIEERYSVFSKEHSFTTYTKPSEPSPGERVPPVPEELQIVDQSNNTTATIGWKAPEYSKQEDEILYYEMIRVDSRTLAKEENSRLLSIKNLLRNNKENDMYAWRTKEALVEEYAKDSDTWSQASPDQASNKLQLEDDTLSPNQIYYYYVRTVLMVEGEEVYSSWVGVPVTTDPVQRPIQLKVENKDTYSHDPKREIVISFLAPIPKGSEIPAEYDFDIAVQGELDDNYRLDYSTTRLTSKVEDKDIPTGYAHFVYKINKVKPGKRYDIKVRVIDKVVDMVNGQYPKSLYSDRVTTRTHFDQDEQDKDDKFQEYLKYFEDKVEALRRKPYWTLEDGANEFSIKYRSNYIIPGINNMKTYQLDVREGVKDFTYYMPASVIASANLNQTSFEIKQGDVTYVVRPATITTELEELKVALEDISAKRIRDYYVAFYFKQIPQATNLGEDGFLTPKIVVDIDLVRLKEEDLFLEDDIMIALNNEINREKTGFINELEKALERGKILNEELDKIIDGSVVAIEKNHQRDVRNILGRNISKTVFIDAWKQSMLIMAITQGSTTAQGYQLGWQDIELPTFNVAGGYGLEATKAGTYAFKGQKITMPVIPGVSGANNLISKYQLTDFFGTNGVINPNNMANKKDVLGAMARVLGAPRGADYVQYLKQRGIKGVTNLGMNLPMKKGEGIYLLMQVYEAHLKKPISTVYVGNRNIVSNIRAFNSAHQPYILVAADTKIISMGSGIKPNDTMQIKDVLQVLTNIMTKLR